ncbi:MAG: hypothetical protein LUQ25_09845 [Methanoregulaceae archaeon]|nr:hypothetical protein [Methanoregulaceae archaeon]
MKVDAPGEFWFVKSGVGVVGVGVKVVSDGTGGWETHPADSTIPKTIVRIINIWVNLGMREHNATPLYKTDPYPRSGPGVLNGNNILCEGVKRKSEEKPGLFFPYL